MNTLIARQLHHSMEPIISQTFYSEEVKEEARAIGIKPWPTGYFAARGWALGRCAPEVIAAAFYNFTADVATAGMPGCWDRASPEAIGASRDRGVTRALARLVPDVDEAAVAMATDALREAAAAGPAEGRVLFAAVNAAPWPTDPPLLDLWHGINRMREFRGDGHVAILVAEGIGPVDALVLYAAMRGAVKEWLLKSRQWPAGDWEASVERLTARGLLADERLTEAGTAFREAIETRTDERAMAPWAALGPERCEALRATIRHVAQQVCDNEGVPPLHRKKFERYG